MDREVPFFSARELNSVTDYVRFYHTLSYLRQRSALFQGAEADRALMAACGYVRAEKWRRRRPLFDSLARGVPLAYLEAIGARLDVLALTAEADLEEYRRALALPFYPTWCIERIIPGFYTSLRLPDGVSEDEAVELMRVRSSRVSRNCCIKFVGLKAIFIYCDGTVRTTYFEPRLRISGGFLMASEDGSRIGTCSIR